MIDFNGSMDAHEVEALREEVTAVLAVAQPADEVVVRLESPGGVVHGAVKPVQESGEFICLFAARNPHP